MTYRILILDDDTDDSFLVMEALAEVETTSYACDACERPSEALEALGREPYDLLICDYRLGAVTGTDFIASLEGEGHDLPSILLTGMADSEADRLALEAGAADFVSKSDLSGAILDRTIRYAIANASRQRLLTTVFDSVEAAVCVADPAGAPLVWNRNFEDLSNAHAQDGERPITALCGTVLSGAGRRAVGPLIMDTSISELTDGRAVVTMHDVTHHVRALEERERAVERADHMATHCPLTGLPNRVAIAERLDAAIGAAKGDGGEVGLFVMDLDGFKEVNDLHGHPAGDALLVEAARRMAACCEGSDFVGRMGGDEFIALTGDAERADALASRLAGAFDAPFTVEGREIMIGVSIGIAGFPEHAADGHDLMAKADIAMFRAKADPSVAVIRYDGDIDRQVLETRRLLADLKTAIADGAIEAHYQPQVDAGTGRVRGFEALARWRHPQLGPISPGVFIPLAEENGLIDELGLQVLRSACREARGWEGNLTLGVNISGVQMADETFPQTLHAVLLETGLPASRLELEVTESVLIDDFGKALLVLRAIKSMGVALAVDDFGTGYSSLATLVAFPFDRLKIDRSFVVGIGGDPRLETVVKACVGLARSLGLEVIAEGIETEDQATYLRELGCDEFQGFLFGRPMPATDVQALLTGAQAGKGDGLRLTA